GFRTLTFQYLLDDGTESEWKNSWNYVENETMPFAVRIIIEGLRGLDEDVWGQEIPIMTSEFGEPDEPLEPQDCESVEGSDSDSGTQAGGTSKPGHPGAGGNDADADDGEE